MTTLEIFFLQNFYESLMKIFTFYLIKSLKYM